MMKQQCARSLSLYIWGAADHQHTSAYVSIRQHTSAHACLRARDAAEALQSLHQHTSAYVSIRQRMLACSRVMLRRLCRA